VTLIPSLIATASRVQFLALSPFISAILVFLIKVRFGPKILRAVGIRANLVKHRLDTFHSNISSVGDSLRRCLDDLYVLFWLLTEVVSLDDALREPLSTT
jgi:hypothetical protein